MGQGTLLHRIVMQSSLASHPVRPQTPPYDTSYDIDKYNGTLMQGTPSSPVRIRNPSFEVPSAQAARFETGGDVSRGSSRIARKPLNGARPLMAPRQQSNPMMGDNLSAPQLDWPLSSTGSTFPSSDHFRTNSEPVPTTMSPAYYASEYDTNGNAEEDYVEEPQQIEQLQYHHSFDPPQRKPVPPTDLSRDHNHDRIPRIPSPYSDSHTTSSNEGSGGAILKNGKHLADRVLTRPISAMTLGSDLHGRGRSVSPQEFRSESSQSPNRNPRGLSAGRSPARKSPDAGMRASTIDLLNIPYAQQMAHQNLAAGNAQLRGAVGANASLMDTRKTLEMYRANVKKTNDSAIQYEFALFMISAAQEMSSAAATDRERDASPVRDIKDREQLLLEAKQILQKLADRSYVYAQYYLADGYFSGLFNKGKEEHDRAFPLFVSAGKRGHAEASYRGALCYEFGWGCRKDYAKSVQYLRQAATKNHPGASTRLGQACLHGDMGLTGRYREGVKWMKRATESADHQHYQAPYELGLLHIHGYGDDIFKDESYAAQLFTKAAELGHPEASLRMGEAYEHGLLSCPKDSALSIHFYTGAAQAGIPKAMMALCAWYMVGAEPVLEKDEAEAYEWARRSAESGTYRRSDCAVPNRQLTMIRLREG